MPPFMLSNEVRIYKRMPNCDFNTFSKSQKKEKNQQQQKKKKREDTLLISLENRGRKQHFTRDSFQSASFLLLNEQKRIPWKEMRWRDG